jgi:hypothetical protein
MIANFKKESKKPYAISTPQVGLKLEGRSSCYDMYHFLQSDNCYAVDSSDNTQRITDSIELKPLIKF